jgi:hypothetical protein
MSVTEAEEVFFAEVEQQIAQFPPTQAYHVELDGKPQHLPYAMAYRIAKRLEWNYFLRPALEAQQER